MGTSGRADRYLVEPRERRRELLAQDDVIVRKPNPLPDPPSRPSLWLVITAAVGIVIVGLITYTITAQNPDLSGVARAFAILGSMLLAIAAIVSVQMVLHQRAIKDYQNEVQQINRSYSAYLKGIQEQLYEVTAEQYQIRHKESPSFRELEHRVITNARNLWDRRPADDDFLAVRVGTTGLPLSVDIKLPDLDDDDPRLAQVMHIKEEFGTVRGLPLLVNLDRIGAVGVRGRHSEALYMVFSMISDLTVHQNPDDVKLFIFSHRQHAAKLWGWARWLPHTAAIRDYRRGLTRLSFSPESDEALLEELERILKRRALQVSQRVEKNDRPIPHLVVVFDSVPELMEHKIVSMLLAHQPDDQTNALGTSAIFIDQSIPRNVNAMISVQENELSYRETWAASANQRRVVGRSEIVELQKMEDLARAMAPLHTAAVHGTGLDVLPGSIRLVELLKATSPVHVDLDVFYQPEYSARGILQFPIGLNTDLRPVELKLREKAFNGHGMHLLVGGTSGTGKTVILQTLALSLALTNSPDHLNLVLADCGGDSSELVQLRGLPHIAGFLSGVNDGLFHNFLAAIDGEVARRKMMLSNASGSVGAPVNNVHSYNQISSDNLLPHLIIIIDNCDQAFAQNDRLCQTIRLVATSGSSLGLHLVLSLQNTADLDGEIKSIFDVRLDLGAPIHEDGLGMQKRPENYTQLHRPGEAFLRVGDDEVFEHIQVARADIPFEADGTRNIKLLDDFAIYRVAADGRKELFYRHKAGMMDRGVRQKSSVLSEAEVLVQVMQTYCAIRYAPVQTIYMPPGLEKTAFPRQKRPEERDGATPITDATKDEWQNDTTLVDGESS